MTATHCFYHPEKTDERKILLAKYFPNPWTMPGGKAGKNYTFHHFDVSLDLFLVNRFFAQEGRHAMASSRNGTYRGHQITSASDSIFWDHAITSIDGDEFGTLDMSCIKGWKRRFPYLTTMRGPADFSSECEEAADFVAAKGLRALLIGTHDGEAIEIAQRYFKGTVGAKWDDFPRGFTINWTDPIALRVPYTPANYLLPEVNSLFESVGKWTDEFPEVWLHIVYSIDAESCRIIERHLGADIRRDSRTPQLDRVMELMVAKIQSADTK